MISFFARDECFSDVKLFMIQNDAKSDEASASEGLLATIDNICEKLSLFTEGQQRTLKRIAQSCCEKNRAVGLESRSSAFHAILRQLDEDKSSSYADLFQLTSENLVHLTAFSPLRGETRDKCFTDSRMVITRADSQASAPDLNGFINLLVSKLELFTPSQKKSLTRLLSTQYEGTTGIYPASLDGELDVTGVRKKKAAADESSYKTVLQRCLRALESMNDGQEAASSKETKRCYIDARAVICHYENRFTRETRGGGSDEEEELGLFCQLLSSKLNLFTVANRRSLRRLIVTHLRPGANHPLPLEPVLSELKHIDENEPDGPSVLGKRARGDSDEKPCGDGAGLRARRRGQLTKT